MTAVAWTDTHLGVTGMGTRMGDMLNQFLVQMVEDIHPDLALCLGDVFHTKKPAADMIEFATAWFRVLADNVPHVVLIPGNHDIDGITGTSAIDFIDDLANNIQIFYEPVAYMDMLFVPYRRVLDADTRDKIRSYPQVFLHQGYADAPLYGNRLYGEKPDSVKGREMEGKSIGLIGHIHTPAACHEDNVYLLGSPYQTRYSEPMLERGFACWTVEDPTDIQFISYKNNFYLEKMTVTAESSKNLVDDVLNRLPSPAHNHYYQVSVTIEGPSTSQQMIGIRQGLAEIYRGALDGVSIVTVLPKTERTFYHQMKVASQMKEKDSAPTEMMATYMKGTKSAFYKANPALYQGIMDEFTDIVRTVDEAGVATNE